MAGPSLPPAGSTTSLPNAGSSPHDRSTQSLGGELPRHAPEEDTRLKRFPGARPWARSRKWPAITFTVLGGACVVLIALLIGRQGTRYQPAGPRPGAQGSGHKPEARSIGDSLAPARGMLRVIATAKGQPIAAELWVDGEPLGQTPIDVAGLDPGVHDLHLEAAGQQAVDKPVSIPPPGSGAEEGEIAEIDFTRVHRLPAP